jgi:CDP-diacylglycerol--glycerol-3-phosphate 3-phosphatidyltransferase
MCGDRRLAAAAVLVLMFATDGLDGYLARRLDRATELGKILDPTADKVAVLAVLVFLVAAGEFPLWALVLVAARDLGILLGGVAIARRSGVVPPPLMVGKVSLVVFAAVTTVFVADLKALEPAALAVCVAAVVASGTAYGVVARRALTGKRTPA